MPRLISLLLVAVMLTFNIIALASCSNDGTGEKNDTGSSETGGTEGGSANGSANSSDDKKDKITVPIYKDYKRDTVNYSQIEYKRPDIENVSAKFNVITALIKENQVSFDFQLTEIKNIEKSYNDIFTMASITNIETSKNSANEYWAAEYEFITTEYPSFAKSVEEMFIAAANSPHAERFEDEYFGEGLIEKYKNGGIYTDKLVALMEEEANLESDYMSLSPATIKITYNDITDTCENILEKYEKDYGLRSPEYIEALYACSSKYNEAVEAAYSDILVSLFKVRSKIGKEYSGGSYLDFAYDSIYHDYSTADMLGFIDDVAKYVMPVYDNLRYNSSALTDYKQTSKPEKTDRVNLINTAYKLLENSDSELYEIYSYMLQHELFDIEDSNTGRNDGAFTVYLESFNAPFIFMSTEGNARDYLTLFHEFGHFADSYINYDSSTSLDLSEVSSQALELLMLTKFEKKTHVSESTLDYLTHYELESALTTLITQSFYSLFEHYAYTIPEELISKESLDAAVVKAAEKIGLSSKTYNSIEAVMIPHIFLYPTYVQSYSTSITTALEIYFIEVENEGEGFSVYKELLNRGETFISFEEHLKRVSLSSPFENNLLKELSNKIHYAMLGKNFHAPSEGNAAA